MKLRNFGVTIIMIITGVSLMADAQEKKAELSLVGEGYCRTSVNTPIFRQHSITSNDSLQYTSFYDDNGSLVIAKRRLGSNEWELRVTEYKGKVYDGHNSISLGLDGDGILHVAFDHHGDSLHYTKTVAPGSLDLEPLQGMNGEKEGNVTYPEFHNFPGGDLLFVYRDGSSGNGNMAMKRYSIADKKWETINDNLIDGENERNAYWQMHVDKKGRIHVSWVWREDWLVETNHDMNYAFSDDGGYSWQMSDGKTYELPIKIENAEKIWDIPQNCELINQTSMSSSEGGNPYIATYWRAADSKVPQYRIIWHDGNKWNMEQVGDRKTPFSLSGGGTKMIPISRPQILINREKVYVIFRDEERGSKVTIASSVLGSGEWKMDDLTEFSVDAWEPSLDEELWKRDKILDIFLQCTHQGDGEKLSDKNEDKTPVYILNVKQFE